MFVLEKLMYTFQNVKLNKIPLNVMAVNLFG